MAVQDGDSLPQGQVALGEDGTLQVIPSMQQGEGNSPVVLNTGWSQRRHTSNFNLNVY